jgi:hypothetical protein
MTRDNGRHEHPRLETLALYRFGDLPLVARWRVGAHLNHCRECAQQSSLFESVRRELRAEADKQTLTAYEAIADWRGLEREMLGNIAVGVAAARCIEGVRRSRALWPMWATLAGLCIVSSAVWFARIPQAQRRHMAEAIRPVLGLGRPDAASPLLTATRDGIAVSARGATLTLLHPRSAVVSLTGVSGVTAQYVDEDTGRVTIAAVYGQ